MKVILVALIVPIAKVSDKGFSLYVQKRHEDGELNGKWEFPGGKIEGGELPKAAALREFKEEVGVSLKEDLVKMFKVYPHDYDDRSVSLFTYAYYDQENCLTDKLTMIDFKYDDDFNSYNIPQANVKILSELSRYIKDEFSLGQWERLWAM